MIQNLMYTPTNARIALTFQSFQYDLSKHNKNIYIHPLIAALFIPLFPDLTDRMLNASFGNIVSTRYNKQSITTRPDYDLLYCISTDPTDLVCDSISSFKDLKLRTDIQVQLWFNVYNLRNAKCYDPSSLDLLSFIDRCDLSNMDNPDILFLSDEGIILRRLFSIFAFRPVLIQTFPVLPNFSLNPLNLFANYVEYSRIPFIVYQIPIHILDANAAPDALPSIMHYNKNLNMYYQDGVLVAKQTKLIDTYGPLIFYIPRKFKKLYSMYDYMNFYKKLNETSLNTNINLTSVKFPLDLVGLYDTSVPYPYITLKSIVYYTELSGMIIGHSSIIFDHDKTHHDFVADKLESEALHTDVIFLYDPLLNKSYPADPRSNNPYYIMRFNKNNIPPAVLDGILHYNTNTTEITLSFDKNKILNKYATILIYEKLKDLTVKP